MMMLFVLTCLTPSKIVPPLSFFGMRTDQNHCSHFQEMRLRSHTAGAGVVPSAPDGWFPRLLGFKSPTFGFQIPDFWVSNPRLLGFKSPTSGKWKSRLF